MKMGFNTVIDQDGSVEKSSMSTNSGDLADQGRMFTIDSPVSSLNTIRFVEKYWKYELLTVEKKIISEN